MLLFPSNALNGYHGYTKMKPLLLSILALSTILASCSGKDGHNPIIFHDKAQEKAEAALKVQEATAALEKAKAAKVQADKELKKANDEALQKAKIKELNDQRVSFQLEKNRVWVDINTEARESFKGIHDIVQNKCSSCHDSTVNLPFYGKIFRQINPVNQHQVDGLKSLDFGKGYPFVAKGNPPQIAVLKAIKTAVLERSMPIKMFTAVYPSKKINDDDEKRIIDWIDPVVEKLQDYDLKYNVSDASIATQAKKILELKCFRCHANGNNKGNFGDMEKTDEMLKGKYVNLVDPDQSRLLTKIIQGKMPPSKLEALTAEETNTVRDWLDLKSKEVPKPK